MNCIMLGTLAASLAKVLIVFSHPGTVLARRGVGRLCLATVRIAYGCNIGAYFVGISSTSLHGWLCLRRLLSVVALAPDSDHGSV